LDSGRCHTAANHQFSAAGSAKLKQRAKWIYRPLTFWISTVKTFLCGYRYFYITQATVKTLQCILNHSHGKREQLSTEEIHGNISIFAK